MFSIYLLCWGGSIWIVRGQSVLSFHHVAPGDQTLVFRLATATLPKEPSHYPSTVLLKLCKPSKSLFLLNRRRKEPQACLCCLGGDLPSCSESYTDHNLPLLGHCQFSFLRHHQSVRGYRSICGHQDSNQGYSWVPFLPRVTVVNLKCLTPSITVIYLTP